jgi:hypothetical protein
MPAPETEISDVLNAHFSLTSEYNPIPHPEKIRGT